jgi:hypothetical protein
MKQLLRKILLSKHKEATENISGHFHLSYAPLSLNIFSVTASRYKTSVSVTLPSFSFSPAFPSYLLRCLNICINHITSNSKKAA